MEHSPEAHDDFIVDITYIISNPVFLPKHLCNTSKVSVIPLHKALNTVSPFSYYIVFFNDETALN